MSKNREKKHTEHLKERQAHEQEAGEEKSHSAEHHLVEVPKGTSRLRFVLNFLLVVFLLLIFSITGPLMDALTGGGGGGDDVYASWTMPNGERRTLSGQAFYQEKRNLAQLQQRGLEGLFAYLRLGNLDPENDEDTAQFLILEDLASSAGIATATDELRETILLIFNNTENYHAYIGGRRGLTEQSFEKMLRRGLAVRRYKALLASGAADIDPTEVAKDWQAANKEYDFQYVQLDTDSLREEARALVPDDEELEDWCNALPPFQQAPLKGEESWSAEVAYFPLGDTELDASILLEHYPRAEDEDLEELATKYYGSFSHVRFVRPEEPEDEPADEEDPENPDEADNVGEDAEGETEGETEEEAEKPQERFYSYEEVADAARREAPIYYALEAWLNELNGQIAEGQVVDLETAAYAMGLHFERVDPRTRGAWSEGEEPWAGEFVARSMMGLPEGRMTSRVIVEKGAFAFARIVEKRAATLKPFPEIKEEVAELWLDKKCSELAAAKLEEIRNALGERPEEGEFKVTAELEEFRAAAAALGFEVVERGFQRRFARPGADPDEETPADAYIRSNSALFLLEEQQLPAAEATRDGKHAFLVRYAGQREADVSEMEPQDLVTTEGRLRQKAEMDFFTKTLDDPEWIKRSFNLFLRSWEDGVEETP